MNKIWSIIKNFFAYKNQRIFKMTSIFLMILVLVTGTLVGVLQLKPPSTPLESDINYPDYKQMLDNLKAMTVIPHPAGSKELESVRSHILERTRGMGLEPIVETEVYSMESLKSELGEGNEIEEYIRSEVHINEDDELVLKNILVKLDAPDTDRGVLIMAHYDTEKGTLGAGDNTISVCALLEAMRKQSKNNDLKNDLYFLFCDGEELGTFGSKAFVKSHPELKTLIDLVINVEGRGNSGGLLMFETSNYNYDLMHYFKSAISHPVAFSFTADLYHKMPNVTDLARFLDDGYSGLNFISTEGVENYGAMSDNYENFGRRTAYNYLKSVQEIVDYSAKEQFQGNNSKKEGVYFPFLPGNLILMSDNVAYFLAVCAIFSALIWLVLQIKNGNIQPRQILIGMARLIGTIFIMAVLSWGITTLAKNTFNLTETSNTELLFIVQTIIFSVGSLFIFILRMRNQSIVEAIADLLPLQLILIIVTTIFFNSMSYLFTLTTLGLLFVLLLGKLNIARLIGSIIIGIGILLLYVPICWLLYVSLMLPIIPVVTALSVLPISIIVAFFTTKHVEEKF